jgi:hypothetical protein
MQSKLKHNGLALDIKAYKERHTCDNLY